MSWIPILTILFSAWTGPGQVFLSGGGLAIQPGVWIATGDSMAHAGVFPLGWATEVVWWAPFSACPPPGQSGCEPQTNRSTVVEVMRLAPVSAYSNKPTRIRWLLFTNYEQDVVAITWQSFGTSGQYRIYSCPMQHLPAGTWAYVGCDVYLPTTEGVITGDNSYVGFGLDFPRPFQGALYLNTLEVWQRASP